MEGEWTARSRVQWWASFAVFAAVGVLWTLTVPRLGGPDEPTHVVKAVAVAHGHLDTGTTMKPGAFGMVIPRTEVPVPQGYRTLLRQVRCWSTSKGVPTSCAPDLPPRAGPDHVISTYVGSYQPTYYAVVGLPSRWLPPEAAILWGRIISTVIIAALLASALASSGAASGALGRLGFLLAVPPAVLYLSGVINPSGIEVVASLGLWTSLLVLIDRPDAPRRVVLRALVAACCLVAVRPLAPAFAFGIVAVVLVVAADRARLRALWARRSVRWASIVGASAWLVSLVFVFATDALGSTIQSPPVGDGTHLGAARFAWHRSSYWLEDQVGLMSWAGLVELHAPDGVVLAWLAAAGVLVVGALAVGTMRRRLVLVGLAAAVLVLPIVAQALKNEVGWQGRYLLPVSVGVPVLAAWTIHRSGRVPARVAAWVLAGAGVLVGIAMFVVQQQMMSRNLYGLGSAVFTEPDASRWSGPLTPGVLRAWSALASIAVAGLIGWLALGPAEERAGGRTDDEDAPPP